VNGAYVLQSGEPVWIPEIGLGWQRTRYLSSLDEGGCTGMTKGNRLLAPAEVAEQAQQQLEQERQITEELPD